MTAQKDRAAVRWRIRGTFDGSGTFQGMRPNGARIDIEGLDLFTVEDELIVDNVAYMNGAELARQLGALPPQGSLAERGDDRRAQREGRRERADRANSRALS